MNLIETGYLRRQSLVGTVLLASLFLKAEIHAFQ